MNRKSFVSIIVFALMFIILICYIGSFGTEGVYAIENCLENISKYGIVEGIAQNLDMFAPFAPLILYIFRSFMFFLPGASMYAIKIAVAGFLILSCIIVKIIYKDDFLAIVLYISMIFSVTNRYLDIFIVPFALLAYFSLKKEKFFLGGVMLAITCLMNYQPFIVMPIIGAGFFNVDLKNKKIHCHFKKFVMAAAGFLIPILIVFIVYRERFIQSVFVAIFKEESLLAPNGLNLGWIIQFFYEKSKGFLQDGAIIIMQNSELIYFKYIFVVGYLVVLTRLLLLETKSMEDVIRSGIIVFILNYLYNTNVYENHLFVGMLLAYLLYTETKTENSRCVFLWTAVTHNLNMLIFYGITGGLFYFERVIMGKIDPTLFLAVLNVLLGSVIIIDQFKSIGGKPSAQTGGEMRRTHLQS